MSPMDILLASGFLLLAVSVTPSSGNIHPFGYTNTAENVQDVEEVSMIVTAGEFIRAYTDPRRPVVFKGAAKQSPAFTRWTDEYLMKLALENPDYEVTVEEVKKENRSVKAGSVSLSTFLQSYNTSDEYMIDSVPPFVSSDILLPSMLSCDIIIQKLLFMNIMWFSSGGTKSVVHTDSAENINCLFSGRKELVLVNSSEYGHLIPGGLTKGQYYDLDVDNVDYDLHPQLNDVVYHIAKVEAGDCLYIPIDWVHQVRSYGRNLAVNFWWEPHEYRYKDLGDRCGKTKPGQYTWTLENSTFHGFHKDLTVDKIRNQFVSALKMLNRPAKYEEFLTFGIGPYDDENLMEYSDGIVAETLKKIFLTLDCNEDDEVSLEDLQHCQAWDDVLSHMNKLVKAYETAEERMLQAEEAVEHESDKHESDKHEFDDALKKDEL